MISNVVLNRVLIEEDNVMGIETERLNFVENRDGKESALAFAIQTYNTYRQALKQSRKRGSCKPHFATLPEYRLGFVLSCLDFRQYIRDNKGT